MSRSVCRWAARHGSFFAAFLALGTVSAGCFEFTPTQQFARIYGGPVPLTLVNNTLANACFVRISPTAIHQWGDDWLGSTEIVEPGYSRTFYVAPNATWDIRIETCRHEAISEAHGIQIAGPVRAGMGSLDRLASARASGGEGSTTRAPWMLDSSAPVTANDASTGSDDVLTLRDGTLLRGHVTELHPLQRVILVLRTGESRTIEWADIASATGPSFSRTRTTTP